MIFLITKEIIEKNNIVLHVFKSLADLIRIQSESNIYYCMQSGAMYYFG